jgi:hypothetical protein
MVNGNYNLLHSSRKSVGGVSVNNNNSGSEPEQTCVNSGREDTLFTSSDIINHIKKSSHHLQGHLSLSVYHQNIGGLRGKVHDLLSQLYPTFPHALPFGTSYELFRATSNLF